MSIAPNAIAKRKKPKIEMVPGEHFAYRMIQHSLSLGGIGALQSELCQTKIGKRIAVLSNNTILVAERTTEHEAVLVTGWNASVEQVRAIDNNEEIVAFLGKGKSENLLVSIA